MGNGDGNTLFFENAPTVSVTAGGNAAEPSTAGSFTLTLSQAAPDGGITVSYTLSGTATNGTDYTIPATATIAAGATTATVSVSPIDDALVEGTETITLTLADAARYNLGAATAATINLTDNDTVPVVTIAATDPAAAETGSNPGTFRISRTGATTGASTVNYAIATGTGQATNGTDYTPTLSGTATIAAGQSFVDFSITPVDDALIEGTETVTLILQDTAAYDLGAAGTQTATVSIADNDTAGFTLSKTSATVSETGTTDSFTVVLNAQPTSDVVLSISASDATEATAGPTLLTFTSTNYNLAQTVTITGVDDAIVDGNQPSTITVSVVDASSNNAFDNLADQTVSVTTLDNDAVINGTSGRDTLTGGSTDDVITGFAGADTITTGGGRDRIVYTNIRDAGDTITDFAAGSDQIVLTQLLDSLVSGGYSGTDAIADGFVRFRSSGANTIVQIDNDGAGTSAIARGYVNLFVSQVESAGG